jgi:putative nucleotidyltransferase with HDIG domain
MPQDESNKDLLPGELNELRRRIRELEKQAVERSRVEEELKKSQKERDVILDSVSDLIVFRNLKMEAVWASRPLLDWLHCTRDEMIGRVCYKARHNRDQPCENCWVVETMNTGRSQERHNVSPDGTNWFVRCNPVYNDAGKLIGTVEISTDVTSIKVARDELQRSLEQTRKLIDGFIVAVAAMVESRDPYTAGHQKRVAELARSIAKEMNLSPETIAFISTASFIHDIGKISVPAEILNKPTKLNEVEFTIIKTHPQVGKNILQGVEFPWPIADIIIKHHERLDGSGYPNGLTGDKIPIEVKIISVADVVEAMASHRPYRPAPGIEKALAEISLNRDRLYDPAVVDVCLKLFREHKFHFEA